MAGPLSSAFLSELSAEEARGAAGEGLEHALRALVDRARAELPGIALDEPQLVRHVGRVLTAGPDLLASLSELHAGELALCHACLLEQPEALRLLDERYLAPLTSSLGSFSVPASEVIQGVREKLLMGSRRLADYSGRGALARWLKAVAVRAAIDLTPRAGQRVSIDDIDAEDLVLVTGDPELDHLRAHYRHELTLALRDALEKLPDRELAVVRMHFVEGLNIDKIGVVYSAHRATVARWIAAARDTLVTETRRALMQRLKVDAAQLDSLIRLVRSGLDLSVERLLRG